MSRSVANAIFLFTLAFFAVFFLWPIAITLKEAFKDPEGGFTIDFIAEVFRNKIYLEGLWNAFLMAFFTTLGCLVLAMPLAMLNVRCNFPGKAILSSLVLVPLILPPFVGAIGVKRILGREGSLNALLDNLGMVDAPIDWLGEGRLFGVVLMNILHLYPILYLNVTAALSNLDPAYEEAAMNLGASPWKKLWKITMPLTMPGIFAGATIVFIWAFTELGVPLIFDYHRVTSVQIFDGIKDIGGNPLPYALVTVMLVATVLMFIASKLLFGRSNFSSSGRASIGRRPTDLSGFKAWLATFAFASVIFLAVLPHLGVLFMSMSTDWYQTVMPKGFTLGHFEDALGHQLTVDSIGNSLKYASLATVFDVFLGIAIAYVIVRTKIFGRQILDGLAMLPLAVPGLVMAFGYLAMTREGRFFDFLIIGKDSNPIIILVIAYAVRRLPYMVRSAVAGFQQTSPSLEEAAMNLGTTSFGALRKITLPLITANLIAGGLLAFAFAMLEVSDSLILAERAEHFPITKAIYTLFSSLGNGEFLASALGVWAMLFLGTTIIGAGLLLGKKLGALFRV